jgi:AMMECR1 domain-containing protein
VSRSGNKALRGCIGTFEARALDVGLKSYALTSYVNSLLARNSHTGKKS